MEFDVEIADLCRSASRVNSLADMNGYYSSTPRPSGRRATQMTMARPSTLGTLWGNLVRPFKDFDDLENVSWTQKFPKEYESYYKIYERPATIRSFYCLAVFWILVVVAVWVLILFHPFQDYSIITNDSDLVSVSALATHIIMSCIVSAILLLMVLQSKWVLPHWALVWSALLAVVCCLSAFGVHVLVGMTSTWPYLVLILAFVAIVNILHIHFLIFLLIAVVSDLTNLIYDLVRSTNSSGVTAAAILAIVTFTLYGFLFCYIRELYRRSVFLKNLQRARMQRRLARETAKSQQLLNSILPRKLVIDLSMIYRQSVDHNPLEMVRRLNMSHVRGVTILFADIVGFTELSSNLEPSMLVNILNSVFSEFDRLAVKYGVEKIKTLGDAYMCVAGESFFNLLASRLLSDDL